MKVFETPIAEIEKFAVEDVLTTSQPSETEALSQQFSLREGNCKDRADDWDFTLENCF